MLFSETTIDDKADLARTTCANTLQACIKCEAVDVLKDGMCERCVDQEKHEALYKCGLSYT